MASNTVSWIDEMFASMERDRAASLTKKARTGPKSITPTT
jgi:hypothetical protein